MSVELGPLPTSAARANVYRNDILCADVVSWRIRPRPEQGEYELFTADQMRAYAEAEVLKERERWERVVNHAGILRAQEQHNAMMAEKDALIDRIRMDLESARSEAVLSVAAERERCAKLCEAHPVIAGSDVEARGYVNAQEHCAAAIRKGSWSLHKTLHKRRDSSRNP